MAQFMTLTCLKCGGKLQIRDDKSEFTCPYCGTVHRYNQDDGMVSLLHIEKSLKNVEKGVDKTAAELAIKRLKEELANMPFKGNRKEIKNDLWELPKTNTAKLALLDCLYYLLDKQNPDRKVSKFAAYFVGRFPDSELREKFFTVLIDGELQVMINYCENQEKNPNTKYPGSYKFIKNKFQTIMDIYAIKRAVEKNKGIVEKE